MDVQLPPFEASRRLWIEGSGSLSKARRLSHLSKALDPATHDGANLTTRTAAELMCLGTHRSAQLSAMVLQIYLLVAPIDVTRIFSRRVSGHWARRTWAEGDPIVSKWANLHLIWGTSSGS